MRLGIVGASGKLGQYLIEQALEEGHQVHGVCRRESMAKLDRFAERITIFPGRTDDPQVIGRALAGCDAVLTVLVPWGVDGYSTGTATAVLASAEPEARLVFSCGWHISRDGRDRYSLRLRMFVAAFGVVAQALRIGDIADQVEACRRIFASARRWTVVRCSAIEEGPGEGLPVWARHVGDPVLKRNRTRRIDFARFMLAAVSDDTLIREAPAISGA
ncbi:MAG: NAD(P)H-binding protein [Sphingomonadales bacterium]|nr:NAD(P)H-binding protein [Sphingomonadales bacterium]